MAVERSISCFQCQSYTSDYLDQTLPSPCSDWVSQHVQNCLTCQKHFEHLRQMIHWIFQEPVAQLPQEIFHQPSLWRRFQGRSIWVFLPHWKLIPWYVRIILEIFIVLALVLGGLFAVPELRKIYLKNVDKNLSNFQDLAFNLSEWETNESDLEVTPEDLAVLNTLNPSTYQKSKKKDDSSIFLGRPELWRFTLKTVSPDELRARVIHVLLGLGIHEDTPGMGGIQVPGGIEFDLILPQNLIPRIKDALLSLAPPSLENTQKSALNQNFTWYCVPAKKSLSRGQSQVVIWLSQMN